MLAMINFNRFEESKVTYITVIWICCETVMLSTVVTVTIAVAIRAIPVNNSIAA